MRIWKFYIERYNVVDHLLVSKKLSVIKENLDFLMKNQKKVTSKNIESDFGLRLQVAHSIQTLIQSCIDICSHLASDERWELPDSSSHAFKIALRHGVLSQDTAEELAKATRLRNVIVHQYDELDEKILEDVVQHRLSLFNQFISAMETWLRKKK